MEAQMSCSWQDEFKGSLARLHECGGDECVEEIVTIFLEDTPAQLARNREAVAHADARALRDAAHRLRGSCFALGLGTIAQRCLQVENLGAAGTVSGADAVLAQIECDLELARLALLEIVQAIRDRRAA